MFEGHLSNTESGRRCERFRTDGRSPTENSLRPSACRQPRGQSRGRVRVIRSRSQSHATVWCRKAKELVAIAGALNESELSLIVRRQRLRGDPGPCGPSEGKGGTARHKTTDLQCGGEWLSQHPGASLSFSTGREGAREEASKNTRAHGLNATVVVVGRHVHFPRRAYRSGQ